MLKGLPDNLEKKFDKKNLYNSMLKSNDFLYSFNSYFFCYKKSSKKGNFYSLFNMRKLKI